MIKLLGLILREIGVFFNRYDLFFYYEYNIYIVILNISVFLEYN